MSVVLEPLDFDCFMSDITTLTVRLDAELKRRLEAFAADAQLGVDVLMEQMIREVLFRNSPEFADPDHPATRFYRAVEAGRIDGLRGHTVALDDVAAQLDPPDGAAKPSDFPPRR